jgi:DNA-binding NtrC family response regulator
MARLLHANYPWISGISNSVTSVAGTGQHAERPLISIESRGGMREIGSTIPSRTMLTMLDIVIFEEDDLMRGLLEEWLTGAGHRVHRATAYGAPTPNDADLVIVSVYMPKHAGKQLVDAIRAAYPGTPLIAISAQFRAGLSTAGTTAQSLGVAQVIAKPLTRAALLGAIGAIISPSSRDLK